MPTFSKRAPLDVLLLERYLAGECTPRERAVVEVHRRPSHGRASATAWTPRGARERGARINFLRASA
jgi:hypothetical protein